MVRAAFAAVALALGSCAAGPEPAKALAQDPKTVLAYFQDLIRAGEFGKAHYLLSAETKTRLKPEPFAVALDSYPSLRRLILETEFAGIVSEAPTRARLIHRWLDWDEAVELRQEFGKIWTFHIPVQTMDRLVERGKDWAFLQFDDVGGYHVFPPDHEFKALQGR